MLVTETELPGVYVLKPTVYGDSRGWFTESWSERTMKASGLDYAFVQDNHSYSSQKGVLRGIHFQAGESAQAKLVRCTRGAVFDVAVDLRRESSTFKKWIALELSAENKKQLLIPRGFGHGFLTLTDDVEFLYKADNFYEASADRGIRWNDPELGIDWGTNEPVLSDKDAQAPFLRDYTS